MLFRCLCKLAISVKKGKEKILRKFCLWFSCLSSIRISFQAKFGDKENATVVKITSTWSLDIRWSYKLVKGRRHRGVQFN